MCDKNQDKQKIGVSMTGDQARFAIEVMKAQMEASVRVKIENSFPDSLPIFSEAKLPVGGLSYADLRGADLSYRNYGKTLMGSRMEYARAEENPELEDDKDGNK